MRSIYIPLHEQLPKRNVIENNRAIKRTKEVLSGGKRSILLKDITEKPI